MLERKFPRPVVDAVEADFLGDPRPELSAEHASRADHTDWRTLLPAWRRARLEVLERRITEFPTSSRVLPTTLGNVLRTTEDSLRHTSDVESFAYASRARAPARIQLQHDQFRTRLDMYCTLTLVATLLAAVSPALLRSSAWWGVPTFAFTLAFASLAVTSYLAAIASARGYCAVLRYLDRLAGAPAQPG